MNPMSLYLILALSQTVIAFYRYRFSCLCARYGIVPLSLQENWLRYRFFKLSLSEYLNSYRFYYLQLWV
jgi:hypothetical protein